MSQTPESQLDSALDAILNEGWQEPATPEPATPEPATPEPATPEPATPESATPEPAVAEEPATQLVPVEPQHPPLPVPMDEMGQPIDEDGQEQPKPVLDIGLLTDLATGKKGAVEAAQAAGVTADELQSQLAVALRNVPPDEISKALGIQAVEQQLKSGALYGAVLADLVNDMLLGRLKASDKLDLAKLLARVGRIEPKEDKNAGVGSGFQLNIMFGGAPQPVTIEG